MKVMLLSGMIVSPDIGRTHSVSGSLRRRKVDHKFSFKHLVMVDSLCQLLKSRSLTDSAVLHPRV